jgi:RNA polymerase sigma-70 factor (ECF subfamily)
MNSSRADVRTAPAGLNGAPPELVRSTVDGLYRSDSRAILATLIRLLGDFDAAEEALHDSFRAALEQWPRDGIPSNPRSWLISAGRFKAIDFRRRQARFDPLGDASNVIPCESQDDSAWEEGTVEDDQLRLVFTCCHPALAPDAQVALTLREVCGLKTEEIASAFLTPTSTIAQRIVRAKGKIRDARIPYQVPALGDLPERLDAVLRVVYLVFNEGYAASAGMSLTRWDLSGEALRLGRLIVSLLPEAEAQGLLALMLLQESRRRARTSPDGDIILLEDQDRSLWNKEQIVEGLSLVSSFPWNSSSGPYALQAAIAAVHASAATATATDWGEITRIYTALLESESSPVVELNRAVAIAMRDGPGAGLLLVDAILARGELAEYHLAHSARGEFCRRLGLIDEARNSYRTALSLARQEPERRFLERKLRILEDSAMSNSPLPVRQ